MVLEAYVLSILQRSERVVRAHLCKPKKEIVCVCVCERERERSMLCYVNSPTTAQGQGHLCEAAARGRRATE